MLDGARSEAPLPSPSLRREEQAHNPHGRQQTAFTPPQAFLHVRLSLLLK